MRIIYFFVLFILFFNLLSFSFISSSISTNKGIFLIENKNGWEKAGFINCTLPVYSENALTDFYMPIALKKEDLHDLVKEDVENTIYNHNQNFTDRLRSISFEIMESDTYWVVLFHMQVYASVKNFNIDFVPKIKGEELSQFSWFNSSWEFYNLYTINSSLIDSSLSNFPVLVKVNDTVGDKTNNGNSCRFLSLDNITQYNFEFDRFVDNEVRLIWVNITSVSSVSDTHFLMYYGNPSCSSGENITGVWDSNFSAVWHWNNSLLDSTSNDIDLTNDGADSNSSGVVGYCYEYVYDNDDNMYHLSFLDDASNHLNDEHTFENWAFHNGVTGESQYYFGKNNDNAVDRIANCRHATNTDLYFWGEANNQGSKFVDSVGTVDVGCWHYCVGVYEANQDLVNFLNITKATGMNIADVIGDGSDNDFYVGTFIDVNSYMEGSIDEMRISNIVRSDAWIKATYHSIGNYDNFMSVGGEVTNQFPILSNEFPSNNSNNVAITYQNVSIYVNDTDDDTVDVYFYNYTGSTYTLFGSNLSVDVSGSAVNVSQENNNYSECGKTYTWCVNVTDVYGNWLNNSYSFSTVACDDITPPYLINLSVINNSYIYPLNYDNISCYIYHNNGSQITYTMWLSNGYDTVTGTSYNNTIYLNLTHWLLTNRNYTLWINLTVDSLTNNSYFYILTYNNALNVSDSEGDIMTIDTTQFGIILQVLLFIVFVWISFKIEGNVQEIKGDKGFHFAPYSSGLFLIFASIDFISMAFILDNYLVGYINEYLGFVGVILLIYSVFKTFYYHTE